MDDAGVGAALRAVRVRRGWRQQDVASRARVARTLVSPVERGHLDGSSLRTLGSIAVSLDVRLDLVARWRGGELDRLINARHSALHESVARFFAIYGERGWEASSVSSWVIVAASKSSERRVAAHRTMLPAAFPDDGRMMQGWLRRPQEPVRALSMWQDHAALQAQATRPTKVRGIVPYRVTTPRLTPPRRPRSS